MSDLNSRVQRLAEERERYEEQTRARVQDSRDKESEAMTFYNERVFPLVDSVVSGLGSPRVYSIDFHSSSKEGHGRVDVVVFASNGRPELHADMTINVSERIKMACRYSGAGNSKPKGEEITMERSSCTREAWVEVLEHFVGKALDRWERPFE